MGMRTFRPARGILGAVKQGPLSSSPVEEAPLVERARRGDHDAFDAIVRANLPRVWAVVWRVLRHRQDTEDVVQEVFLTAYESLPGFRGEASLSTWLHRIAVTRALNHRDRAAERIRRASQPLAQEDAAGAGRDLPDGIAAAGISPDPTPLQLLEADELRRRLSHCLDRLPEAWRAILCLRDAESQAYQEISRTLGIALGTVRSRLARARDALRRCVEGGTP